MTACKYATAAGANLPEWDNLTSREAAKLAGVGKSSVNNHRNGDCSCGTQPKAEAGESETHNADGSANYVRFSLRPWGFEDYREFIRSTGQDPDKVTFSWGWTSNATGNGFWNKLNNVRPKPVDAAAEDINLPALYAAAKQATPQPSQNGSDRATIVVWADPQIGKTGSRGGTVELIERSTLIRKKLYRLLEERTPSQILIADAGDGIEGFESGGNPMFTNDLSLSGQLDTYGTELFEFINLAHQFAPVTVAGIPSNHAAWRCGKQNLGKPSDDLGLFMHKQVGKVTAAAGMDVSWVRPAEYDESVAVDFHGTRIGLVHGNQFGPGQAVAWWQKQAFGAQAAATADVLVHGHYHSFSASVAGRNPVNGRQRYCLGAPTLDNGSDWFRQVDGRDSDPGLMVFDVTPDGFDLSSLTILTA
ncbi:hypothetical protein [Paenarthrobacter sp. YJN-5]|uniref:hypothetical protein n=1 Tax=Paenarthrobacter sp. YJN-5 TaxID=2735316 RepID=UPI0018783CF8|nr:hypothetical protein [Paenarthrobacter sp. YJN-5]QOT15890.1 hypothetical protein HMI59_04320 [Paenarthrobacter sp. YJN-5]